MYKTRGQSLIEFVVIMPLLIIIIFGIIEYALFWRTTQTVQTISLESAIGAGTKFVTEDSASNTAVDKAREIIENRIGSLGLQEINFTEENMGNSYGTKPFALYKFNSNETRDVDGSSVPVISFTVDYRNPYENGVVTQIIYQYQTVLMGAEFTLPGGRKVTIIPRNFEISSTKIQQCNSY